MADLLDSVYTPITRPQWAEWLETNLAEFKENMKSAPSRRREMNTRVRAREDLPAPATWAKNLAGRAGWHGLQTATEKSMFFLICHNRVTYYVDLEPYRRTAAAHAGLTYALTEEFNLDLQLRPLSALDASIPDAGVLGVFCYEVEARLTCSRCVEVWPARGAHIRGPLPKKKQKENDCDEEAAGVDSESSVVVDTAGESASDDGSSSATSSELGRTATAHEPRPEEALAEPRHVEQAEGKRRFSKVAPLWDNGYFCIPDNSLSGAPDLKICVHTYWTHAPPGGLGGDQRSKTLTPSHYGESRDNPARTRVLLRAWMLWRARWYGWVKGDRGRARQFQEEEILLERGIRELPSPRAGILGDTKADALLRSWVPDLVATLAS